MCRIDVDLSGMFFGSGQDSTRGQAWELIVHEIVRRSPTFDHVTVVSAFTCTNMRPGGFGGRAVLITTDSIKGKTTNDILEDFLTETTADPGPARSHVLVRLDESSVRAEIAQMIETDQTVTTLTVDAMTDADIHGACCDVVEQTDLSEELRCRGVSGGARRYPRSGTAARFHLISQHSFHPRSPAFASGSSRFGDTS
jgi:hypothetical protein